MSASSLPEHRADRKAAGPLAGLALAMLLSSLGTSIANVALPRLAEAFAAPFAAVQWVVLAYLLAMTTLVVSVGRLADLFGRRRLLLAGIAVFVLASLVCALAPQLWLLIAARAGQGLGAAVMMSLSMALVGDAVDKSRAGRAMGLLGTVSAVGTALGPSLGGLLIAAFDWRSIFLLQLPLGALAAGLAYRHLPTDPAPARAASFDGRGAALLAATLLAFALSMTLGRGGLGGLEIALLVAALLGGGMFLRQQSRRPSPLLDPALLREPAIAAGLAMSTLTTAVAMTTLIVGPFHLGRGLGLDTAAVGLVMTCGPLAAAFTGVPAGRAVDRYGADRVGAAGLLAMVAGCSALAAAPLTLGVIAYLLPLILTTSGFALFQAANNTRVMAAAGAARRGVVAGLLTLSRNLGLICGASLMGAVFAAASGAVDVRAATPAAIALGSQAAFALAAVLVAIALLLAALPWSRQRSPAA